MNCFVEPVIACELARNDGLETQLGQIAFLRRIKAGR